MKYKYLLLWSLIVCGVCNSLFAQRRVETLNRGIVAVQTPEGAFISWRFLPTDNPETEFILLRNGQEIARLDNSAGTNYLDKSGNADSCYQIQNGNQLSAPVHVWKEGFLPLTLDRPGEQIMPDGERCTYTPNDCGVGDFDSDGQYELVVKWSPSNSRDNAQNGYTGTTFLDAYTLDGKKLWRINLGINIRSGAHYTPFLVYDFDSDGKAEVICKTADGTVDGVGKILGDSQADYRNESGRILDGPEFLTVFDGMTGAEICTINYPARRNMRKMDKNADGWGDNYGNRCDRFLACAACLDGKQTSAVFCRGYYTAAYVMAFDFDGKSLNLRWFHKSETPGEGLYGEGNHNIAVGDLDSDGKDEIVYGSAALDDDGTLLYRTGFGHGDALHLFAGSSFNHSNQNEDKASSPPPLYVFCVHEDKNSPYGMELRDCRGKVLWGRGAGFDVGRGLAADIDPNSPGVECWSYAADGVWSQTGKRISDNRPSQNFRIYWDGDLQDELFDRGNIDSYKNGRLASFYKINHSTYINGTKANPNLQADILGDWREEVILFNADNPAQINIFTTTIPTPYRVECLMFDPVYRMGIVWQNVGYNQPPHTGFYLPDRVQNKTVDKKIQTGTIP